MTGNQHAAPGWITSAYPAGDDYLQAERQRVRFNLRAMRDYQAECAALGIAPRYAAGQTPDNLYAELSECGLYRNGGNKPK